jgi:mannose-1-phosphate guanylyltransferase
VGFEADSGGGINIPAHPIVGAGGPQTGALPAGLAVSAVVLAAGRGERLRPYTDSAPKALLPVLDVPILGIIVSQLASAGVRRIGINAFHLARQVTNFADEWSKELGGDGLEVRTEQSLTGPAGALRLFEDLIRTSAVTVVVSGDALAALDVGTLVQRHLDANALFGVLIKRMPKARRFGVVEAREDGGVVAWREKPPVPDHETHSVSCGVYTVSGSALDVLPTSGVVDFGVDLASPLLAGAYPLVATLQDGYWSDIGTPMALLEANLDAALGITGICHLDCRSGLTTARSRKHAMNADRAECIYVAEDVYLGRGVTIVGPAVIGSQAHVGDGAHIERAVLLPGASVPPGARVVERLVH